LLPHHNKKYGYTTYSSFFTTCFGSMCHHQVFHLFICTCIDLLVCNGPPRSISGIVLHFYLYQNMVVGSNSVIHKKSINFGLTTLHPQKFGSDQFSIICWTAHKMWSSCCQSFRVRSPSGNILHTQRPLIHSHPNYLHKN
jgi:hypothetical protein